MGDIGANLQRRQMEQQLQAARDELARIKKQQEDQVNARPGTIVNTPTKYELKAGVSAPNYEGVRDVKTGELLSPYKTDVYKGEALQALKKQAFGEGLSPWAQVQMKQQALEQQNAQDMAGRQQMQAQGMAQGQLARGAGLTGGASALLARQGARDLLNAQQGISRQGMGQRVGIQSEDINRKNQLLTGFGNAEQGAQASDIGLLTNDLARKALFDTERYKQQMQAWGAEKSADATRAAGGGGGGGKK